MAFTGNRQHRHRLGVQVRHAVYRVLHVQGPGLGRQIPGRIAEPEEGRQMGFLALGHHLGRSIVQKSRAQHAVHSAQLRHQFRHRLQEVREIAGPVDSGRSQVKPVSDRLFPGAEAWLQLQQDPSIVAMRPRGHLAVRQIPNLVPRSLPPLCRGAGAGARHPLHPGARPYL